MQRTQHQRAEPLNVNRVRPALPFSQLRSFWAMVLSPTPSWVTTLSWWRGLHNPMKPCHESCHAGSLKMDRSQWSVLMKHSPLGEEMAAHLSILAKRTPCAYALLLSRVWLLATPWTVTHQAPLFVKFFRQENWRVAISYSRGSFWPRDRICVFCISCILGRFFTTVPPEKPRELHDSVKRQKDMTLQMSAPRSEGVQYTTR